MTDIPFLTVPFSISDASMAVLRKECYYTFNQHTAEKELINFDPEVKNRIRSSNAWREILEFCTRYGLPEPVDQLFFYRKSKFPTVAHKGNPHIDTCGPSGVDFDVKFRFNILIEGHENTEMVWWNIDKNDGRVIESKMKKYDGAWVSRLQASGNTLLDRWRTVSTPDYSSRKLVKFQQYASFVRTDILHAINWDGFHDRLIYSLRWTEPSWEVLANTVKTLQEENSGLFAKF